MTRIHVGITLASTAAAGALLLGAPTIAQADVVSNNSPSATVDEGTGGSLTFNFTVTDPFRVGNSIEVTEVKVKGSYGFFETDKAFVDRKAVFDTAPHAPLSSFDVTVNFTTPSQDGWWDDKETGVTTVDGTLFWRAVGSAGGFETPFSGKINVVDVNAPHPGGGPEPETYALLIVGFGLIGATGRMRRKSRPSATPA
jgi:hypothetical protein